MNPGTTASLICPACGQAFLSTQQSLGGLAQCPHCAHHAPRAHFGTQAQVAGVAQVRRRVFQAQPQSPASAPPQDEHAFPPEAMSWQPVPPPVSIARQTLHPSLALLPTAAPPPPPEEFVTPPHLRPPPWRGAFITLALVVVCAGALWLWWDRSGTPPAKADSAVALPPAKVEARDTRPVPPAQPSPAVPPPDVEAVAADAKALVTELFAADTPARRAACINDAERYGAEIEEQFGAAGAKKTELRLLSRIPGLPLTLPGGQPVPLFQLVTSACSGGALIRLEKGADGRRRIFWPLLYESHAARLPAFMAQPGAEAAWFYVALRPSHGLDIAAELRPKYLTFDMQASAASVPHFVACVERDTPLGRFMDHETEWGRTYLARLLMRRLDIPSDAPCLLVIDSEGAPER